jgi:hypothetical protein
MVQLGKWFDSVNTVGLRQDILFGAAFGNGGAGWAYFSSFDILQKSDPSIE